MVKIKNLNLELRSLGIEGRYKRDESPETTVRVDLGIYKYLKQMFSKEKKSMKMSKLINQLIIEYIYAENVKKLFIGTEVLFHLHPGDHFIASALLAKYKIKTLSISPTDRTTLKVRTVKVARNGSHERGLVANSSLLKVKFNRNKSANELSVIKILTDFCIEAAVLESSIKSLQVKRVFWNSLDSNRPTKAYEFLFNKWNFGYDKVLDMNKVTHTVFKEHLDKKDKKSKSKSLNLPVGPVRLK